MPVAKALHGLRQISDLALVPYPPDQFSALIFGGFWTEHNNGTFGKLLGDLVEYGLEFRALKPDDPDSLPHPQAAARSKPICMGRSPREGGLP
jgi:hypothetical protein